METSITPGWSDFLVASAGASAALAGLLFVAISINLTRVIETPGVSGRAAEGMILLSCTLAVTMLALMPFDSRTMLATALLPFTIAAWLLPVWIQLRSIWRHTYKRIPHAVVRAVMHQTATLPGVLAGLSLCGFLPGGMFWLGFGVVASMLVAIINAWILLVEILR